VRSRMIGAALVASVAAVAAVATPARAFCEYDGVLYAKTTIAQEFRDSRYVVRARLLAADYHWSDEDESWTTYKVRILRYYKGAGPAKLKVFTYRNSGGFYLDKGSNPDLEGEYLLFLHAPFSQLPKGARGAWDVNYSCGKSGTWAKVPASDRQTLERLSRRR
jgi:hypothetical protein